MLSGKFERLPQVRRGGGLPVARAFERPPTDGDRGRRRLRIVRGEGERRSRSVDRPANGEVLFARPEVALFADDLEIGVARVELLRGQQAH